MKCPYCKSELVLNGRKEFYEDLLQHVFDPNNDEDFNEERDVFECSRPCSSSLFLDCFWDELGDIYPKSVGKNQYDDLIAPKDAIGGISYKMELTFKLRNILVPFYKVFMRNKAKQLKTTVQSLAFNQAKRIVDRWYPYPNAPEAKVLNGVQRISETPKWQ